MNQVRGLLLVGGIDGGEDPTNGHRPDSLPLHIPGGFPDALPVKGRNFPAVELVASSYHISSLADGRLQLRRPVHQGRKQLGGRQGQTDYCRGRQIFAFQQSVGEVSGTYHHRLNSGVGGNRFQQFFNSADNARGHVCGGRDLGSANKPVAVHQDGVSVGTPYIYTYKHAKAPAPAKACSRCRNRNDGDPIPPSLPV